MRWKFENFPYDLIPCLGAFLIFSLTLSTCFSTNSYILKQRLLLYRPPERHHALRLIRPGPPPLFWHFLSLKTTRQTDSKATIRLLCLRLDSLRRVCWTQLAASRGAETFSEGGLFQSGQHLFPSLLWFRSFSASWASSTTNSTFQPLAFLAEPEAFSLNGDFFSLIASVAVFRRSPRGTLSPAL